MSWRSRYVGAPKAGVAPAKKTGPGCGLLKRSQPTRSRFRKLFAAPLENVAETSDEVSVSPAQTGAEDCYADRKPRPMSGKISAGQTDSTAVLIARDV